VVLVAPFFYSVWMRTIFHGFFRMLLWKRTSFYFLGVCAKHMVGEVYASISCCFVRCQYVEKWSVQSACEMTWLVRKKRNCVSRKWFCMVHPGSSKLGLAMESLEELLCKVMSYFL